MRKKRVKVTMDDFDISEIVKKYSHLNLYFNVSKELTNIKEGKKDSSSAYNELFPNKFELRSTSLSSNYSGPVARRAVLGGWG